MPPLVRAARKLGAVRPDCGRRVRIAGEAHDHVFRCSEVVATSRPATIGQAMLGMGLPEIGVVLVVGLLLFGPDRLPEMARQAAKFVKVARRMVDDAKADLEDELGGDLDLRSLDPRDIIRQAIDEDDPQP